VIAMIFEFWLDTDGGVVDEYGTTATELRELLVGLDGFEGVERFESCSEPGKFAALGFFRDEDAVGRWRNDPAHRRAQELGRTRFFTDYRLRMAEVMRDYGPDHRREAPLDSRRHHEHQDGDT
jgi:heme-degrading monooxygenase HmoA